VPTFKGSANLTPAHFFAGVCVSPFKQLESEQVTQYYKLGKKLRAGAQFIVTQLGFDARKFQEALQMVSLLGYPEIPVIGNIYVLPFPAGRAMNRNTVPGCVVTEKLLKVLEEEAADKTKAKGKRLERAARMYAFMKGMGFAGVHIGGHNMSYEDVEFIIGRGEELAPNWRDVVPEFDFPQPNGWYYFEKDAQTGLNSQVPVDRSKERPQTPFVYRGFRLLHHSMFDPHGIFFQPSRWMARALDGSKLDPAFTWLEHVAKGLTNDCLHCGDCGLPDCAYVCPTSQCPKGQRNGPCGGGFEGWCEVYPGKRQCIYVRAYTRLKHYKEEETLGAYQVPPVNYDLLNTASWLNYFMGRDHTAKRLGVEPPKKKEAAPDK
jgi:methylenetetrahydrofolate reductase (NADPH)